MGSSSSRIEEPHYITYKDLNESVYPVIKNIIFEYLPNFNTLQTNLELLSRDLLCGIKQLPKKKVSDDYMETKDISVIEAVDERHYLTSYAPEIQRLKVINYSEKELDTFVLYDTIIFVDIDYLEGKRACMFKLGTEGEYTTFKELCEQFVEMLGEYNKTINTYIGGAGILSGILSEAMFINFFTQMILDSDLQAYTFYSSMRPHILALNDHQEDHKMALKKKIFKCKWKRGKAYNSC